MPQVPASQHSTGAAVIQWRARLPQEHREHLGASLIGHACDRHIWYSFRWAATPTWDGRMLRLFDRGKREEAVVAEELRGIGVELHTDENGKQIECRDESGHFGGSVDGIGRGFPEAPKSWAILEVKTHSAKSFTDLKKNGVGESKPAHYAQMQSYMGLLGVERALYFAVNKDNDEIYTEWVHFDEDAFKAMQARARRIIDAGEPPAKLSEAVAGANRGLGKGTYARGGGGPLRDLAASGTATMNVRSPATGARLAAVGIPGAAVLAQPAVAGPAGAAMLGLVGTQTGRRAAAGLTRPQMLAQAMEERMKQQVPEIYRDATAEYLQRLLVASGQR